MCWYYNIMLQKTYFSIFSFLKMIRLEKRAVKNSWWDKRFFSRAWPGEVAWDLNCYFRLVKVGNFCPAHPLLPPPCALTHSYVILPMDPNVLHAPGLILCARRPVATVYSIGEFFGLQACLIGLITPNEKLNPFFANIGLHVWSVYTGGGSIFSLTFIRNKISKLRPFPEENDTTIL